MDERAIGRLRDRLDGRTKRDLVGGMISHSPHPAATAKILHALEVYPLLMLMQAHDYPTRIWVLDRGEKLSSAAILDAAAKERRWHQSGLSIDDCEGVTDVVEGSVAMITTWKSLLVIRHEFAHAITTFFPPKVKQCLHALYSRARERGEFTEPLASESLGEYVACGVSYLFFDDLRQELEEVDRDLLTLVSRLVNQAEAISEQLCIGGPR